MLYVPAQEFQWKLSSEAGVRPAAAYGTSVTPGNNTKGAWVEVFSAAEVEFDVYGVLINLNSFNVQAAARDAIVDIGTDPAGGTSYTTVIPNLLASAAAALFVSGAGIGVNYYFPLFIKAGSSIAARASVNNATVGTGRVWMTLFGLPRRPEMCKVGSFVEAFGIVEASSRGTLVTPGTTSDGAWTSLGTPTLPHWWWQIGMGMNDASSALATQFADLAAGDATNKIVLLEDVQFCTASTESIMKPGEWSPDFRVDANVELWGRLQDSGTPSSNMSLAAYGLGG